MEANGAVRGVGFWVCRILHRVCSFGFAPAPENGVVLFEDG
jgi:hypothetical protein